MRTRRAELARPHEQRVWASFPRPAILEWVCLFVGLTLVARYRWIFDDSYVYFRYVDNLLYLGGGLTYNAGEFVEGFTSPLHCVVLIVLRALSLPYPVIVLGIGAGCYSLSWWLLVGLNRTAAEEQHIQSAHRWSWTQFNLPLVFLCCNYSALSFYSAGNEGPLLHLTAIGYAVWLLRPSSRVGFFLVAISPLVRPELGLALGAALLVRWFQSRRFPWKLAGLALFANGTWLVFRIAYYADLAPNTFYLKAWVELESSSRWARGWNYAREAVQPYSGGAALLLACALGSAWQVHRFGMRLHMGARAGMLLIAGLSTIWVVASGGSAMHYYYLAFPLTLALCATTGLMGGALAAARSRTRWAGLGLMLAIGLAVLASYPATLSRHPLTRAERMKVLPSDTVVTDPSFFRQAPESDLPWPTIDQLQKVGRQIRAEGYSAWTDVGSCNAIYRNPGVRSVHAYGLTDAILARVKTPEAKRGHKPALPGLALDLIRIQMANPQGREGVYTAAIDAGSAPPWMAGNREAIDTLEAKVFGDRGLWKGLRLAFSFPEAIELPRSTAPSPGTPNLVHNRR